jgi:hypothetical protein
MKGTTKVCMICKAEYRTHAGADACQRAHKAAQEIERAQAGKGKGRRSHDAGTRRTAVRTAALSFSLLLALPAGLPRCGQPTPVPKARCNADGWTQPDGIDRRSRPCKPAQR